MKGFLSIITSWILVFMQWVLIKKKTLPLKFYYFVKKLRTWMKWQKWKRQVDNCGQKQENMSSHPQSPQRRQTTDTNSWNHRIPAETGETENWDSLDIFGWTSLVYTVHLETTRQALFQTRWRVRTNTKACPLTLTHAWWHVGTYIHTHEWVHTNTCCIQMILSWQIPFFS